MRQRVASWVVVLLCGCAGSAGGLEPDVTELVQDGGLLKSHVFDVFRGNRGRGRGGGVTPDAGGSTADAGQGTQDAGGATVPPLTPVFFTSTTDDFKNPERGFLNGYLGLTDAESSCAWLTQAQDGLPAYTLAGVLVRLDLFRSIALPASKLTELANALGRIRSSGLRVVLRFEYRDPGSPLPGDANPGDATGSAILGHIAQLALLL